MKLLSKDNYEKVEELLRNYETMKVLEISFSEAYKELIEFFNIPLYKEFLKIFYFNRYQYKNRYPDNRSMFKYLSSKLFLQESTLYMIRKEIVYKSAMIFYKYNILSDKEED